jgi:hypothetical protein
MSLAEQPGILWRRSKACNPIQCVEVALCQDRVLVRDSKNPEAGFLEFTRDEWRTFLRGVARREFTDS